MIVTIIGGAGSVGSILTDRFLREGKHVYVIDQDETALFRLKRKHGDNIRIFCGDYTDATDRAYRFAVEGHPIIHAAAYKHVGICEKHAGTAIGNNLEKFRKFLGKYSLPSAVYISTDKAVNPRGVMGATKMLAERMAIQEGWNVVRFGNVWGSRGSIGDTIRRDVYAADDGTVLTYAARGGDETTRFKMLEEDVFELVKAAAMTGFRPVIAVPTGLEERPVKELMQEEFESAVEKYGKENITLNLEDAPLDFGEKHREQLLWEEELKWMKPLSEKVAIVGY
jgi:FlaA1/EpsC-like NDP-sugar epimerase